MENSLELIELSSINKVSLAWVPFCSNTESIRDDPYWTSRKTNLELIEYKYLIDKVLHFFQSIKLSVAQRTTRLLFLLLHC